MEPVQFSELTSKLHRNLLIAASLIICVAGFDITVRKVSTSGVEFDNLTTRVILLALLAVLIYHAVAFGIRAFEDYRNWELRLVDKTATAWGGGVFVLELADQLKDVAGLLDKITANSGLVAQQNQTVISSEDAKKLLEAADASCTYGKRLKNFPVITRVRFWFWDVGIAFAMFVVAALFACSILPAGLIGRWLQV